MAETHAQLSALTTAITHLRVSRSLTFTDDEHDPEGSTASLDQARDAALLHRAQQTSAELDAAQQRLVSGTYGVCEGCGRQIPTERLLARPEARFCLPCAGGRRRAELGTEHHSD